MSQLHKVFIIILLATIATHHHASGHRILTIFLISGRSNMNYFDPIHLELARKGHHVTVITPTPSLVKHENIREYPGLDFTNVVKGMVNSADFFQMRLAGERMGTPFASMASKFAVDCDAFHQLPVVQELIAGGANQFDLVMTMAFMNECVYGIFHRMNASSVIISTVPTMPWFTGQIGTPTPLSFVPHIYYEGSQEMSFVERVGNMLSYAYQMITRNYVFLPAIEAAYQKYIPEAPGVNEILRNASLVMGAGHPSFGPIRPTMPDLIDDIGGIHCRPAEPLPQEIIEMIGDKQFVFFSLGSIVQGHQIPDHIRHVFLNTFAKFPEYQFLWKWEANTMKNGEGGEENLPNNVKISKWFPQQDVLGHSSCILFITHGGLSSLHESIYHGVPVIGIPFFGDQDWNMKQVEYHDIGRKLELSEISDESLTKILLDVLNDSKYTEQVAKRSALFRDRQVSALDKAVWNIEHVLRHHGATHLQSPGRNMNMFQYYSLDILSLILILTLLPIFFVYSCVCHKLSGGKNNHTQKKKAE